MNLQQLRVASPCHERWADMVGDERARHCRACNRQVFDLSEMTQAEAEALLGGHGVMPCVRFYRRADGTVMTSDCPTGARRSKRLAVVAGAMAAGATVAIASPAAADPVDPDPEVIDLDETGETMGVIAPPPETELDAEDLAPAAPQSELGWEDTYTMGIPDIEPTFELDHRPRFEWSTWLRLGYGTESTAPAGVARATVPPSAEHHGAWEAALGADLTLGVAKHGDLRLGAWTEVRTSSGPVLGGELVLDGVPGHLDMFQFDGTGIFALRAGGNAHVVTAAVAYGYLAPWKLWGPWNGATRYMIGVRLVASATRSVDDPRDWSATAGIEFEPIGALRYVLGIRSWY